MTFSEDAAGAELSPCEGCPELGMVVVPFIGPKMMSRDPDQGSRTQSQAPASTWHCLGQAWDLDKQKLCPWTQKEEGVFWGGGGLE